MIKGINEKIKDIGSFLKKGVNPFLAPFFAILNYLTLTDKIADSHWVKITFLILTLLYTTFSLALAIYQVFIKR